MRSGDLNAVAAAVEMNSLTARLDLAANEYDKRSVCGNSARDVHARITLAPLCLWHVSDWRGDQEVAAELVWFDDLPCSECQLAKEERCSSLNSGIKELAAVSK